MKNHPLRKVLVIQTASIGDVILATPVLERLHNSFPDAAIDMLIKKGTEELFHGHPFLNNLIIWDKSRNKYSNLFRLLLQIRRRDYDLVVNIQRFFSTGFLTVCSGARYTSGFDKNPLSLLFTMRTRHTVGTFPEPIHETERNLMLLKPFCNAGDPEVRLYPQHDHYLNTGQYNKRPFITIAPSSLWFTKQLPEAKWIEFIQQLSSNITVFLLGSKHDRELNSRIVVACSANYNVVDLSGKLSLLESAALMKHAAMNYTNDSAPMHLASAVNAPVTVVFCSTIPQFGFTPLSDKSFIIETQQELPCRPCGLHGKKLCPEKHFKCATTISVDKLLSTLT